MKELAKDVMNSVPQYLINFSKMFGSPRQFPIQQLPADEQGNKESLTNALKFGLISLVLIVLLNYYRLDKEVVENIYSELAAVSMAIILVICLSTLCIYLSWCIFGSKRKFIDYLIINSYSFGVIFVIYFVSIIISDGYLRANDPVAFANEIAARRAGIPFDESRFVNPHILSAYFITVAGGLFVFIWGCISWGAYRRMNGANWFRALLAFLVAFAFGSFAAWFTRMLLIGMGAL